MGKVQEWRFHGLLAHPFHIHITPFQIISLNVSLFPNTWFTSYFEVGDYHDTLLLPQMSATGFGNSTSALVNPNEISKFLFKVIVCRLAGKILTFFFLCLFSVALRTQPGPYGGYAVMHCHFLHHEDAGCMKVRIN